MYSIQDSFNPLSFSTANELAIFSLRPILGHNRRASGGRTKMKFRKAVLSFAITAGKRAVGAGAVESGATYQQSSRTNEAQ